MNKLCLLAGLVLSLAGCASSDNGSAKIAKGDSASDSYTPTGTLLPRKKSQGAIQNVSQADRQAIENDQVTNAGR